MFEAEHERARRGDDFGLVDAINGSMCELEAMADALQALDPTKLKRTVSYQAICEDILSQAYTVRETMEAWRHAKAFEAHQEADELVYMAATEHEKEIMWGVKPVDQGSVWYLQQGDTIKRLDDNQAKFWYHTNGLNHVSPFRGNAA